MCHHALRLAIGVSIISKSFSSDVKGEASPLTPTYPLQDCSLKTGIKDKFNI